MDTEAIDLVIFALLLVGAVVIPDSIRFVKEFNKTVREDAQKKDTVEIDKEVLVKLLGYR